MYQILAIIQLSDLYILESPLTLHGSRLWSPCAWGSVSDTYPAQTPACLVTLNHTITSTSRDSFHADEVLVC